MLLSFVDLVELPLETVYVFLMQGRFSKGMMVKWAESTIKKCMIAEKVRERGTRWKT